MKKIYSILFFVASLFVFAPALSAQDYLEANGFGYKKSVSGPVDGRYTIKLESFVKGKVEVTHTSIPADIVLVLDISGSMAYDMDEESGNSNERLIAMQNAVKAFIAKIVENDRIDPDTGLDREGGPLGNRIAIVTFASSATTENVLTDLDDEGIGELEETIDNLSANGATNAPAGMQNALTLLRGLPSTRKSRTVVFFTDGVPGQWAEWEPINRMSTDSYTTWSYANSTINYANQIKNLGTSTNGVSSRVFTVSIINNPEPYTQVYLGKVSSDFTGATSMGTIQTGGLFFTYNYVNWNSSNIWANGDGDWSEGVEAPGGKFAYTAHDTEGLKAVFEAIADASGGQSVPVDSNAIVEVDVISSSFTLPEGADTDDIIVHTYKCTGVDPNTHKLTFSTTATDVGYYNIVTGEGDDAVTTTYGPVSITTGETVGDKTYGKITVQVDTEKNEIKTQGFDFAANMCGTHGYDSNNQVIYDGYKLVIEIPIEVADNAVGGSSVATNEPGSGILVNGTPVLTFNQPDVPLPVNLWVMKTGLNKYESAKFIVQRKPVSGGTWTDYTSFVLTGGLNEESHKVVVDGVEGEYTGPTIKILGLDSNYYYRVVEEGWSWQYGSSALTSATTETLKGNPVLFNNTETPTNVLHAESKAANDFGNGTSVTYSSKHTEGSYIDD